MTWRRLRAATAASLAVGLGLAGCSSSTPVAVTNRAAAPVEDLVVSGTGFVRRVGTVAPGRTVVVRVEPTGESGLAVSFQVGARQVRAPAQGHFEAGGSYAVGAVIAPDLRVAVEARLR